MILKTKNGQSTSSPFIQIFSVSCIESALLLFGRIAAGMASEW
jgi:hypothetical protein